MTPPTLSPQDAARTALLKCRLRLANNDIPEPLELNDALILLDHASELARLRAPVGDAMEERLAWALCCGTPHCDAANHAPDHDISADGYAERYGCECSDIQKQVEAIAPVVAAALTAAEARGAQVANLPPFGSGLLVVDTGRRDGKHAVFIRAAKEPGVVGQSAAREGGPLNALSPGEVVLTFNDENHAQLIADSLIDPQAGVRQGIEMAAQGITHLWENEHGVVQKTRDCLDLDDVQEAIRALVPAAPEGGEG